MNATIDTEQHWQELHNAPAHSLADVLKSATDTIRRSPIIGIGGAAIVGFAIGRLLLGNRSHPLSKLIAASALPLASKGLHETSSFLKARALRTGKVTRRQVHQGLEKAGEWLHALKR
ncbi:MAG: hypothetical protein JWO82_4321 [Akkermansiaceae bacterium]|nr:hypothetical protein [Akkermansiaceae bacterium]